MARASWTPNQGVNILDHGERHHGAVTLGAGKRVVVLEEQRNDQDVTQRPVARVHTISRECDSASSRIDVWSDNSPDQNRPIGQGRAAAEQGGSLAPAVLQRSEAKSDISGTFLRTGTYIISSFWGTKPFKRIDSFIVCPYQSDVPSDEQQH